MKSAGKLFLSILLAALGIFIIYLSLYHRLIEIFILVGIILFIIGLYFSLVIFLDNYKDNKPKRIKSIDSVPNYKTFSKNVSSKNSKINKKGSKKIVNKVKNTSKAKNPNELLKKPNSKVKSTSKKLKFTPNYERPVKVCRKPLRKSDLIDVSNAPDISKIPKISKSKEIFEALASEEFIEPEHNIENHKIPNRDTKQSQKPNFNPSNSTSSSEIDHKTSSSEIDVKTSSSEIDDKIKNEPEKSQNTVSFSDLKNSVLTPDGITSSKKAFEQLINSAKTEILLETSSINDIDKKFFSRVSGLNVRIIIQEFDMEDMSIMLSVDSLLEQGVYIRVLPFVNTTNLIVDEKNALIVSENEIEEEIEVGAVYDEIKDVLEIKDTFEKSWDLATDLT